MLKKNWCCWGRGSNRTVLAICNRQIGEKIYLDTVGKYENPYLTISSESYDRGYLNSDAVSRIEIKEDWKPVFDEEGLPTVWFIHHKVSHGFMGVTSTSELVLDEDLQPLPISFGEKGFRRSALQQPRP